MNAPDDKDARIARLVELEAKATRAPWNSGGIRPTTVEKGTIHVDVDQPYEKYVVRAVYSTPQGRCTQFVAEMLTTARHEEETPANAALIAAVRNELPWLLPELARLQDDLRRVTEERDAESGDAGCGVNVDTGETITWKQALAHRMTVFLMAKRRAEEAEATVARLERENAALREGLVPDRPAHIESFGWVEADEDRPKRFTATVCFPDGPPTNSAVTFATIWQRHPIALIDLAPTASTERTDAPSPEHRDETRVGS